ncbi:MAG: hypothetical protein ACREIV_13260, partial [Planctomycetaceae bacterium]
MDIRCHCPHCRQRLSIAARRAGRMVRCPACAERFVVPDRDGGEAVPVPAKPAAAETATAAAPLSVSVAAPRLPERVSTSPARPATPFVAPAAAASDDDDDDDGGFQT